jgi:hypothetical protein
VLLVGRIKLLSRGETDLVLVLLGKILGVFMEEVDGFLVSKRRNRETPILPEEEEDGPTVQRIDDRDGVNLYTVGGGQRYLCRCSNPEYLVHSYPI